MDTRLTRFGSVPAGLVLLVAGLAASTAAAGPAHAAAECQGRPVTIAATADGQRLSGTDGPDVISTAGFRRVEAAGLGGDDVICTSARLAAVLDGGPGDDTLVDLEAGAGGASKDATILRAGPGADRYLGVAGTILSYEGRPAGVRVDLSAGTAVDSGETDTVSGIHVVWGTPFPDTFVGTPDADTFLTPLDGNVSYTRDVDTVDTGAGDDAVGTYGGTVHAGPGDDRVSVLGGTIFGGPGDDDLGLLDGGRADGGSGDDTLGGDALADRGFTTRHVRPRFRLSGGAGDDVLLTPYVVVDGGSACTERCARSTLRGGAGADLLAVQDDVSGLRVDLQAGRARLRGDVMRVGSIENVRGGRYADVIRGHAGRNRLSGGGGRDVLLGRGGRDVLRGGPGRDRADGGPGRDRCRAESRRSCP